MRAQQQILAQWVYLMQTKPWQALSYFQVDISIWLRSCTGDQPETAGQLTGNIPTWLSGSLIQNGPGKFSFGSDVFKHLFDGSAVLQKFTIANGNVHYSCKFVKTKV